MHNDGGSKLNESKNDCNHSNNENALAEYSATQEAYLHYDNFAWQVGSVLIAGVFVYWGFIVSNPPVLLLTLTSNMLICFLMSIWLLYAGHNRQIYMYKLHRIHELEKILGMRQHRRFKDWDENEKKVYFLDKPVGHYLDYGIYIIVSLGGLIPAVIHNVICTWGVLECILLTLNIIIVFFVVRHVHVMEKKAKELISILESK